MISRNQMLRCASVLTLLAMAACSDSGSSSDSEETKSSSSNTSQNGEQFEEGYTYVTVSEIMYNAPDNSPLEWVELTIASGSDIDNMLDYNLHLDGAISFAFPAEPLKVGEYIVVANDPALFKQTYPKFEGRLFGPWGDDPKTNALAKLANEGDVIDVKITGKGDISCAYSKEPPWSSLADGNGHTLVYIGGNATQASSWAASKKPLGNPGAKDEYITPTKVRLNEIQPFVLGVSDGWVELYNAGKEAVDVSGWIFESKYKGASWKIAKGTVPAEGFLVLKANDTSVFGEEIILNPKGGEYYLYETVDGKKTGAESSLLLAASNLTSGVVDVSDGSTAQGALESATEGKPNSAFKVGPVFVDEIYYHPAEEAGAIPFEFMELVNRGKTDVNLYETKNGKSKGWKVEGINMEFGSGTILPAGGRMVLISDLYEKDTSSIRKEYGIDGKVQIRLYKGKLSNRGETVAVKQPFDFDMVEDEGLSTVQWYYDWSDATLYSDTWDGLTDADGYGYSLQRVDYETMGYEASAWKASKPTLGK